MKSIARQLEVQYPESNRDQSATVIALSENIVGDIRPILLVLLSGAGLLLLIACVNVVSLLLARSESRRREIAVRNALGASWTRLMRQFATEGLVLVALAGAAGVALAGWTMRLLTTLLIPEDAFARMPYLAGVGLNKHVLIFAGAQLALAAVLFALAPLVRMRLGDVRDGLAEGGRGSGGRMWRRFGANLVAVELATAVVLLVGAGLLGKSFYRLLHVDLGIDATHLATLDVGVPDVLYPKAEQQVLLAHRLMERVEEVPGVKAAALASLSPLSGNGNTDWIRIVGKPYSGGHIEVNQRDVTPDYLKAVQARLIIGRFFTAADDATKKHVVVINKKLAEEYFPGDDPIGQKYGDVTLKPESMVEIVGVVDNIREGSLDDPIWPAEYRPFDQSADTFFSVLVRTEQDDKSMLAPIAAAVREVEPNSGIVSAVTMSDKMEQSQTAYLHRSSTWVVGGFACMATFLGVIGLYGVISYSVSQRTREIGVRMALGAPKPVVYRMILWEAGRVTAIGIVCGLMCAVLAATAMRTLLFGVETWDVPTLAGVAALLGIFALCAAFVPARRAAGLDPAVVLRAE